MNERNEEMTKIIQAVDLIGFEVIEIQPAQKENGVGGFEDSRREIQLRISRVK